jgi:lipopolysaccharide/colanic/teichoic acid biosynthesis glycosyltransferase
MSSILEIDQDGLSMRRCVDICVASIVLLVLSPLFILISLLVVTDSPGSPFYGGWRAGKSGRRFRMWKFRTMVNNADRLGSAITTKRDPRVTRVGGFLRKTKLDELPQFFNLFLGDVTLVGPRPEDPGITEHYTPEQRQLLKVKPGITGPTQLHFTSVEAEMIPDGPEAQKYYIDHILDQKLKLDLEYLNTRTIFSDLRVISQTVFLMTRALTPSRN